MRKNKNGFFLAETIIMIALVTTVVAFLYPNVSKLYENYNNRVNYYDQVQDIYVLRAIEEYLTSDPDRKKCLVDRANTLAEETAIEGDDINRIKRIYFKNQPIPSFLGYRGKVIDRVKDCDDFIFAIEDNILGNTGLSKLYITGYMETPTSKFYEFNKYLRRLKKTTNSPSAYRLIGVFNGEDGKMSTDDDRYASIKVLLEG